MKKIISGLAAALAIAAHNEIFTLILLLIGAGCGVAALAKGCEAKHHNDIWEVL